MKTLLLTLAIATTCFGQAVRFDSEVTTVNASCVSGKQCPLLALPGSSISVCQGSPATKALCQASPATTYTAAGAGTTCSTLAQLTPSTGGACRSTADSQGNWGMWVLPGSYSYFITVPSTAGGGTTGPYPLSIQGAAGGYVLDSLYATLAEACTAAGTGTLAITKAWNAVPTQTLSCKLWFLTLGKIQPASGAVVTIASTITAPAAQIFDYSASGTVSLSGAKLSSGVLPQWFGAVGNGTTDDAAAVLAAIAAAPAGKCVVYFPAATYRISSLGTLSKVCTLDFGNSTILADTTGIWLTVPANTDSGERVIFKDAIFDQYAAVVPTDIFKLAGQPDTLFENISFYTVHTSHSLVWNYSVYGTTFHGGKWVFNTVDAGVNNALLYASYAAAGDFSTFTIDMSMDGVDMSNNTGKCVGLEGGDFSFTNSVIESCSLGGIEHVTDKWFITNMVLDHVYMEANGVFNLKFPKSTGNPNVSVSSNVTINSSQFTANPSSTILILGEHTILNFTNNISSIGCIDSGFSVTAGSVYAAGNSLFGNTAGCSANHQYLFKTAVDAFMPVTGYGSIQSVGMYPWTQAPNPSEFKSTDTTAGAHIANFRDNANAIKAHVNIEGDITSGRDTVAVQDVLSGRDVSVSRYLILKGAGNVHNWACQTANYTSADDLICFYDGNVRFKIANSGYVAFGASPSMNLNLNSPLSTGALAAHANNAAALAAGLRVGDYYRTGADPDLVAQVH